MQKSISKEGIKKLAERYNYESVKELEAEYSKDRLEELVLKDMVEAWLVENNK